MSKMDTKKPLEWSFHYEGPIHPLDLRTCVMCNAAAAKGCPRDGHATPALHCTSCAAAKDGYCPNHCGIEEALKRHPEPHGIEGDLHRSWDVFAAGLMAQVRALPEDASKLFVHAVAHERQPEMPIAVVELELRASE